MSNDEYDDKWVDSDVDSERYEVPEGDYILELLEIQKGVEVFDTLSGQNVWKIPWKFAVYNLDGTEHINPNFDQILHCTFRVTKSMHKRSNTYKLLNNLNALAKHDDTREQWQANAIGKRLQARAEKWTTDSGEERCSFTVRNTYKLMQQPTGKENTQQPEGESVDF